MIFFHSVLAHVMDANAEKTLKRKLSSDQKNEGNTIKKMKSEIAVDVASEATEIKIVEFAACRAREIEAMTQNIKTGSVNHRVYQRLPKHMRRRAMSHDPKRMPRRLRNAHILELEKSKTKPVSKRPSRRYRRRPKNLQSEYAKRKRRVMWLETHIWHAKRFHMGEKWGYKIPLYPNEKGIRAAHRAVSKHCLLNDLSFMCCIEVTGAESEILSTFSHLSDKATGLSIGAKAVINGARKGTITLYQHDSYPYNVIGPATFVWKPATPKTSKTGGISASPMDTDEVCVSEEVRQLWIWVHPSCYQLVLNELQMVLGLPVEMKGDNVEVTKGVCHSFGTQPCEPSRIEIDQVCHSENKSTGSKVESKCDAKAVENVVTKDSKSAKEETSKTNDPNAAVDSVKTGGKRKKKQKNVPKSDKNVVPSNPSFGNDKVTVTSLKDELVRFRLTGPLSQAILLDLLSIADVDSAAGQEPDAKWWEKFYSKTVHYHYHDEQSELWDVMKLAKTPSDCCSNAVVALTVRDPRIFLPKKKTHFTDQEKERLPLSSEDALKLCRPYVSGVSMSPIWDGTVRKQSNDKISTHELNAKRSELLVPGTDLHLGAEESRIPILLLQNPGTTTTAGDKKADHGLSSYGCGWDMVVPGGWGMAFWLGLIFRGARASGLREFNSTSVEMRALCFPRDYPDGLPGRTWAEEHKQELETKFCERPPSKRPNFQKLNVQAPFCQPWKILVDYWKNARGVEPSLRTDQSEQNRGNTFYIVRDNNHLGELSKFCSCSSPVLIGPEQFHGALVAVTLSMCGRGSPAEMAMICIPSKKDMEMLAKEKTFGGPCEPKGNVKKAQKPAKKRDETPRNALPDLDVSNVVTSCTRKVLGFLTEGKFSLVRGSGLGQGFCAVQGLYQLEDFHRVQGQLIVLVRDTNSFLYRFARLSVLKI